jgi:ligand-binding sensor domain-containing protein
MAETPDGKVWLGTRDNGLFYMSDGRVVAVPSGIAGASIKCLLVAGDHELWIGTDKGVLRWNGVKVTSADIAPGLVHLNVLSMIRDRDSNIWFGTPGGLIRASAGGFSSDIATRERTPQ